LEESIDLFALFADLDKNKVVLSYSGELSQEMMGSLMNTVEQDLIENEPDKKVKKKVFNVLVESLQNLFHHASSISKSETPKGMVIVVNQTDYYAILTGNYIMSNQQAALKKRIEDVNGMTKEELKTEYQRILQNGTLSEKGGAGLGIIDLARRTREQIDCKFVDNNSDKIFFSLKVKVAK
jgi:hypothetical protein